MTEDRCAAPFEMVTEHLLLPSGCAPEHPDALSFEVRVKYKGEHRGRSGGGWSVENRGQVLSRAGNWAFEVPRFRRWQYRFDTEADALAAARHVVGDVQVMGLTWAQLQERDPGPSPHKHPAPPAKALQEEGLCPKEGVVEIYSEGDYDIDLDDIEEHLQQYRPDADDTDDKDI